jgi:hypothetical protein
MRLITIQHIFNTGNLLEQEVSKLKVILLGKCLLMLSSESFILPCTNRNIKLSGDKVQEQQTGHAVLKGITRNFIEFELERLKERKTR